MEDIFKDYRFKVEDNGFSDRVMQRVMEQIPEPKKSIYRIPTLVASLCSITAIIIVAFTAELGEISQKYEEMVENYQNRRYAEFVENDENNHYEHFDDQNLHLQESDFQ